MSLGLGGDGEKKVPARIALAAPEIDESDVAAVVEVLRSTTIFPEPKWTWWWTPWPAPWKRLLNEWCL